MIHWIQGQNTIGKTLLIKKLLGAQFELEKYGAPVELINNPLDIEKDFPSKLVAQDFIFHYNIVMPTHITLTRKCSQIHIFIKKERGKAKEYNKIFRLYKKFCEQNDVIKERQKRINEIEDYIADVRARYQKHKILHDEEVNELKEKIRHRESLSNELDKLEEVTEFRLYQEKLSKCVKSKKQLMWNELNHFKEEHEEILDPLLEKQKEIFHEMNKMSDFFDLHRKLREIEKNEPDPVYTYYEEDKLRYLKRLLTNYIKKKVTEEEVFEEIKSSLFEKSVWIDGKPSSDFSDFYSLIHKAHEITDKTLFISHCGPKMWFKNLNNFSYVNTNTGMKLNINLIELFKNIYIEIPTMDEKVIIK